MTPLGHDGGMTAPARLVRPARVPAPVQLTLLPESSLPDRLRLDRRTRELGLRRVAEIKQRLAALAADRAPDRAA